MNSKRGHGKRNDAKPKLSPTSVMFVPNSYGGILTKKLEQLEPMLERLCGYRVRMVEAAGTPLSRLFSLDMSDGRCHRADCHVCITHNGKGSSRCKRKSVVYLSLCQVCKLSNSDQGCYVGETGRSLYERSKEHVEDAINLKEGSHILKHWATAHPNLLTLPAFSFHVVRTHKSSLDRQIHEAVKIAECGTLNAKCEYRQNQVKRLSVHLTERELKAAEDKAAKLDAEIGSAIKVLVNKL